MLGFARLRPTVCARFPLYDPENVRVPLVAVSALSELPRAIPLMVELVRPVLSNVPVTVCVNVSAPAAAVTV